MKRRSGTSLGAHDRRGGVRHTSSGEAGHESWKGLNLSISRMHVWYGSVTCPATPRVAYQWRHWRLLSRQSCLPIGLPARQAAVVEGLHALGHPPGSSLNGQRLYPMEGSRPAGRPVPHLVGRQETNVEPILVDRACGRVVGPGCAWVCGGRERGWGSRVGGRARSRRRGVGEARESDTLVLRTDSDTEHCRPVQSSAVR